MEEDPTCHQPPGEGRDGEAARVGMEEGGAIGGVLEGDSKGSEENCADLQG